MGFINLVTCHLKSLYKNVMWLVDSIILFFTDLIEVILTFFSSMFLIDRPTDRLTYDDYNRIKPGGSDFKLWGKKQSNR